MPGSEYELMRPISAAPAANVAREVDAATSDRDIAVERDASSHVLQRSPVSRASGLHQLQRKFGNRYVASMLQARASAAER